MNKQKTFKQDVKLTKARKCKIQADSDLKCYSAVNTRYDVLYWFESLQYLSMMEKKHWEGNVSLNSKTGRFFFSIA